MFWFFLEDIVYQIEIHRRHLGHMQLNKCGGKLPIWKARFRCFAQPFLGRLPWWGHPASILTSFHYLSWKNFPTSLLGWTPWMAKLLLHNLHHAPVKEYSEHFTLIISCCWQVSEVWSFFCKDRYLVNEYQVVKVSPGGSHLGANWERAGSKLEWGKRDECYTRF